MQPAGTGGGSVVEDTDNPPVIIPAFGQERKGYAHIFCIAFLILFPNLFVAVSCLVAHPSMQRAIQLPGNQLARPTHQQLVSATAL